MVSAGPILNIDYITRRVSFDRNDVLFMMVQGEMTTPSANYIETKTKETCKALTFRLYSNGVSALFFGDYSVLNSIYIEYALKSIDACNRLIGKC